MAALAIYAGLLRKFKENLVLDCRLVRHRDLLLYHQEIPVDIAKPAVVLNIVDAVLQVSVTFRQICDE